MRWNTPGSVVLRDSRFSLRPAGDKIVPSNIFPEKSPPGSSGVSSCRGWWPFESPRRRWRVSCDTSTGVYCRKDSSFIHAFRRFHLNASQGGDFNVAGINPREKSWRESKNSRNYFVKREENVKLRIRGVIHARCEGSLWWRHNSVPGGEIISWQKFFLQLYASRGYQTTSKESSSKFVLFYLYLTSFIIIYINFIYI